MMPDERASRPLIAIDGDRCQATAPRRSALPRARAALAR